MIQELLGAGGGVLVQEKKVAPPSGLMIDGSSSSSSTTNTTTPSNSTMSSLTTSSTEQQNLRCPRCDSSNTKFCYYNNYNLTQPRHFCKTCRRYWTKGGSLRNVPIGGGCRKTKSVGVAIGKSSSGGGCKAKVTLSSDMITGKFGGLGHELSPSQILWSSAHNSQLMAWLRSAQGSNANHLPSSNSNPNPNPNSNPNPNPNPNPNQNYVNSHFMPDTTVAANPLHAKLLGVDPLSQIPIGFCSPLWKNQYNQSQHQQQPQQQHNMLFPGEQVTTGSAIHDLYQRFKSNSHADHSQVVMGNLGSSSATSTTATTVTTTTTTTTATTTANANGSVMEQTPLGGGELGYWNMPLYWSDMPATNIGAFP